MKHISEFNTCTFPRFMDGKTFREKSTYVSYLLEQGYAYTGPLRQEASNGLGRLVRDSPDRDLSIADENQSNPLSAQNATVAEMFDAIESNAKKGRRRKSTDSDSRSN